MSKSIPKPDSRKNVRIGSRKDYIRLTKNNLIFFNILYQEQ